MRAARNSRDKVAQSRAPRATAAGAGNGASHAARLPDLAALSDQDLGALVKLVEQEQAARRERKRADFFVSMREQAQALGVAPEDLVAELSRKNQHQVRDRRAKVAPKYRNPANPSETWAGRGVRPKWMQALLAQGHTLDEFRIASRSGAGQ